MKVQTSSFLGRFLFSGFGRFVLFSSLAMLVLGLGIFTYLYLHFGAIVDKKLREGPFANTSILYAAPEQVAVGDPGSPQELAASLRRTGYSENSNNRIGHYRVRSNAIEINPGIDSYFDSEGGVIQFEDGKVSQIVSLRDNTTRKLFLLEPEVITNLFDKKREKRRLVKFEDIPPLVKNALISAEDKRFFDHGGIDILRVIKSAYEDIRSGSNKQGASTLSMQLARSFFLTNERTWKRKVAEVFIALNLEAKLSKEEIFEFYANEIYLGQRGSFAIHGFAQGAQAFFNKDLGQLNLPEAALLTGMIQGPSIYVPWRYPDRAKRRRNIILSLMRENGFITQREYETAAEAPLGIGKATSDPGDAPYFVDLVNETLSDQFNEYDFHSHQYRIYTTLDPNLQRAAQEAVESGMKEVDNLLKNYYKKGYPQAQVALVALDAESGEIRALVGGRDYGQSQLNRALAKRQPGSVFKPFVYAAAFNTALSNDGNGAITPASLLEDEPTVFEYNGRTYEPGNFGDKFYGTVTVRDAITRSLNIPAVKLAERAGFPQVVAVARGAGLNDGIKPTPSVALGSYEVTPIEIAGAYTTFPNGGQAVSPTWIRGIRDSGRRTVFEAQAKRSRALDPRVNYLIVSLMQDVVNRGTGAGIRSRGFQLPAAGKTGTSHDGWFSGFTSKLVCAVWVGFDDNRELPLEGGKSALPVWAAFMKKAHTYRQYSRVHSFAAPQGITSVEIDPDTGELAGPSCPRRREEYFIEGTQPTNVCPHSGGGTQILGFGDDKKDGEKKKGFFGRLKDIFN